MTRQVRFRDENRTYTTQAAFMRAADSLCAAVAMGLSISDLPDTVFVDSFYVKGCGTDEVRDYVWEVLDNAGYPRGLLNEAIYGTDEMGEPLTDEGGE